MSNFGERLVYNVICKCFCCHYIIHFVCIVLLYNLWVVLTQYQYYTCVFMMKLVQQQPTLSLPPESSRNNPRPLFLTAGKMTSQQCIVAGPVSAKNMYTPIPIWDKSKNKNCWHVKKVQTLSWVGLARSSCSSLI